MALPKITIDPKVLREAVIAAGVQAQGGLEAKIGAPGCKGEPFAVVGTGTLRGLSSSKAFRVVCDWGVFAIHPDDAGWVLRAVEAYMPVKPVWMKGSRKFFRGGKLVTIPAGFDFVPTQWTCPECIPKAVWKNDEIVGYDNAKCDPSCDAGNVDDAYHSDRRERFGYDNRVMHPWTEDKEAYAAPACTKQPGSANTICLPFALISGTESTRGFCTLSGSDLKYRAALWQSAGIGIRAYNAHVADVAKQKSLPGVLPPGSSQAAPGSSQVKPKPNYVPAVVAAALTGIGAWLISRR